MIIIGRYRELSTIDRRKKQNNLLRAGEELKACVYSMPFIQ